MLTPDAPERLRRHILASIEVKQRTLAACEPAILAAAEAIAASLRQGGKLMLCGNGGSAADSQHIAAEFVSLLNKSSPRAGLAAVALTTDSSILTSSANDFGFAAVFERQAQALGRPGDVLIGISTSGESENVLRALAYARGHGMRAIGMTGCPAGRMPEVSELCLAAPSNVTSLIQEAHIMIGHILCDLVEQALK